MKISTASRFCAVISLAIALLAPSRAIADDALATAQKLFDDAVKLMEGGAYERACPKLEEVVKLQPAKIGARMELAGCYEKWGKLASAWSRYRTAADSAAAVKDRREAEARAKINELAKRSPKLIVTVALANRETKGFTVEQDGREIGVSEWDSALPVDPGEHALVASAPGKKRWTGSVTVAIGGAPATIEIPVLPNEMPSPVAIAPLTPALPPSESPPIEEAPPAAIPPSPMPFGGAPPTAIPPSLSPMRSPDANESLSVDSVASAWPWIVGGVGIAALGVATGFGIDGLSAKSSLEDMCSGGASTPCEGHTAGEIDPLNARKDRGLGVFIGVGAAGIAGVLTGVVGIVNSRKSATMTASTRIVVPVAGPGFGGAVVGGSF